MLRLRLLGALLAWTVSAVAAAAPTFDLSELMASLARVDRSVVSFEETRHFAALASPIVRRGTLQYVRPDRLEMNVVTPFPETTQI
ncbi:MAG: outer membrane lipoprotein carrier protein LolA, partial [Betaproteobacteria bacterium]